jgi:hypothetical protein
MLKFIKTLNFLIMGTVLMGLAACGSGDITVAGGGIGGTGVISTGEVTALGSIWVNDVKFETSGANLYIDDALAGKGDAIVKGKLSPGRIVRVEGTLNEDGTGIAQDVFYTSTLIGPVDAVDSVDVADPEKVRIQLLGQTVMVDAQSRLEGMGGEGAAGLTPGNFVEISGYFNSKGEIQASFVNKMADEAPVNAMFQVAGRVSGFNANGRTFRITALSVDFSHAHMAGFLAGEPTNGMYVFVRGQIDAGGTMIATSVEPYGRLGENNAKKLHIKGIAGDFVQDNRFYLEGYEIETTPETGFAGGVREDLLPGLKIIVQGAFVDGIIVADKIIMF